MRLIVGILLSILIFSGSVFANTGGDRSGAAFFSAAENPTAHDSDNAPLYLADRKHKHKDKDDDDDDDDDHHRKYDCNLPPGLEKQGKVPPGWEKKCRGVTNTNPPTGHGAKPTANWATNDIECKQLAVQASGGTLTEAVKGAVVGGALGAAAGAVVGSAKGEAGKGAAIGGAVGGTAGAIKQTVEAEQQYKHAYENCMRGRGEPTR